MLRVSIVLALAAGWLGLVPLAPSAADFFAVQAFERQWQADEARTPNYWGPLSTARDPLLEPYTGATSGPVCRPPQPCIAILFLDKRTVQYFDKGRMEQMNPGEAVTSGLLATEMVRGKMQMGDNAFEDRTPPNIPIAGDLDNIAPTYATLQRQAAFLLARARPTLTVPATLFVSTSGEVFGGDPTSGQSGPTVISAYDDPTGHNVVEAFVGYRDMAGFATIGLAISEPFRAMLKVGGRQKDVLIQAFERRVLTYTPSNPAEFRVEMGNIGQHYSTWRYGDAAGASASQPSDAATCCRTAPGGGTPLHPSVQPLAGWFGVFPELAGYQRAFLAPVVDRGDTPAVYRQTAQYIWTGGALKMLDVTIARDPALARRYGPATLRQAIPPYTSVPLGTVSGWLWHVGEESTGASEAVRWRLIVPLAAAKVVILEGSGAGPWEDPLGLARQFDFARITTALDTPPRTDARRTLDAFRFLTRATPLSDVAAWVGDPEDDIGSGIHVLVYVLPDDSRVLIGTADYRGLLYVNHVRTDGTVAQLV